MTGEVSYRRLIEGIVDVAIFMLEADGTIASWNAAAARIKGYTAEEIIGRHFSVFYTASDIERGVPDRTLETARVEGKFAGEGWRVRKDGTRFWASVVLDALYDNVGALIGFAKITRDATDASVKEEQRRVIVDAAPNGMLVIDQAGTVALANPQAERLFGYRPGAMTGLAAERLLTGDAIDRPVYLNALPVLDRMAAPAEFRAQENLLGCRRDGSTFPAEVTFNATPTAHGQVIVASVADVTERRALERERRESEEALIKANRLMSMAEDLAHYGHWRVDLLTGAVEWSPEVYRIHGLPRSFKPTIDAGLTFYDPNGVDVAAMVRQASIDGAPFSLESRILRPDGTFRDVRCTGRAERDGEGTIVAIEGIFADITERKDAERERDRLIERATLAPQAGTVGIWEWSISAGTMTWDDHMFALYGFEASVGPPTYERWHAALYEWDRERTLRDLHDALAGRRPFDTDFRIVWPSGAVRTIRAQATVVHDDAGAPVRMVGINWDISDVRSLSEQLHEEKERAHVYERDRLYEHARKWSTTFQRAVLPLALPRVAGCSFDAVYEPGLGDAQVGGDWYDAVHLIDGRVLVSIGDVSGSGLEAAVVVGVVRQIMRGIAQLHASPMLILDAADRALCLEYPGIYVSAWVGLIDLVTRTITYASAGHPPPLIVANDGAVRELRDESTLLIGLRESHHGQAISVPIAQGDTFVLYTDGVTEAEHDVIAGTSALREAAQVLATKPGRHPADIVKRLVIPNGSLDDVAILVVRTDVREAERFIERWQFSVRDPAAAAGARRQLIESLEAHVFTSEEGANAELILGELIGNIVRHAPQSHQIDVAVDHAGPHSVLHVLDRGGGFHHVSRLPSDPYAESGRGLFLIAALSLDFTVAERPDGGSHARVVLRGGMRQRPDGRRSAGTARLA